MTHTEVISAFAPDSDDPDPAAIDHAANLLRAGALVAFPTETVYGLGANALSVPAVARIFEAKGRPPNNPVIVHVVDAAAAADLTTVWPDAAKRLAQAFWPGPLTLVLPKRDIIPDNITGGGATVALRVPSHPIALALLRAAGIPVAAPSANRSTSLSPTTAQHVLRGLDGRIELILDGGPTTGGIESTVLSLGAGRPRLLRPGLISPGQLEHIVGPVEYGTSQSDRDSATSISANHTVQPLASPGMMARHYAPRATLEVRTDAESRVRQLISEGRTVGWLTRSARAPSALDQPHLHRTQMPPEPEAYAAHLYGALHALDELGVSYIVVDELPETDSWLAIRDRLRRASTPPDN